MRTCEYCGGQAEQKVAKCPKCRNWSGAVLLELVRDPDPAVRKHAASNMILAPTETEDQLLFALGEALRDPSVDVRKNAGVTLFCFGAKAVKVIPHLLEALDDPDVKVRSLAAATLSIIGPPAKGALPKLAALRDTEDSWLRVWVAEAERTITDR